MKKLYLFALFLVIYEFTTYVSNDMIMPGMLTVVNEFQAPLSYVSLSLSLYILGNCCLQLFLGPLSERFGKRKLILAGSAFFLFMTLIVTLSQNIESFMLARFLQGSGLGFIAMGYALIHELFDDKTAVKTFALMGNISILAPLLGPLLGVFILMHFDWRYIFVITGVLAIIAFIGLFKFTPITTQKQHRLNLSFNLKMYGKILRTRQFIWGAISSGIAVLPIIVWIGLSPTLIMKTLHHEMIDYGVYQVIAIGGLMISSILMQFVAGRITFYKLMLFTVFLSFLGLILGYVFKAHLNAVVWGMCLYSFGVGIFNNLVTRLIMTTPDLPQSMVSSLMVFIQTFIFSMGVEVATHVCDIFGYSLSLFTLINFILGCMFFVLVSVYACMHKNKKWD